MKLIKWIKSIFRKEHAIPNYDFNKCDGMYVISYGRKKNNLYDLYSSDDKLIANKIDYETLEELIR